MAKQTSSAPLIALVVILALALGGAGVYLVMSRQQTVTVQVELPKFPKLDRPPTPGEFFGGNLPVAPAEDVLAATREKALTDKLVDRLQGRTLYTRTDFDRLAPESKAKVLRAFYGQLPKGATLYTARYGETTITGSYTPALGYVPHTSPETP